MLRKTFITIIIALILILAGGGVYYWYFFVKAPASDSTEQTGSTGFSPFNRNNVTPQKTVSQLPVTQESTTTPVQNLPFKLPKLRQLSETPVAGMSASSTATSSVVRFIERGTGHIYEANDFSNTINKISNTTLPKIYESYWNKNLTAMVVRYLKDESDIITNFYTELRKTGTSTSETPYEIKGKYLSPDINEVAVSPNGDKIFTWNIENGNGVGYISAFDEKGKIKLIDTPITQVSIDWPETNTLLLTTKASSVASGYEYTIDSRVGTMKKVLGPIRGLSGKMSRDLSKIFYSSGGTNSIKTNLFVMKDSSTQEIIFKTLADKCVWSNLRKNEVYCAVPTEIPDAVYPDDWYRGNVSFVDQIWHLDTITGEVHLLANLLTLSNSLIDAVQLTLDPKEDMLYFINKRDLTLWSLDLSQ